MSQDVPEITVEPTRRSIWQRLSVVWLVPLAALLIALGIAWQSFADRGPLIEITFDDAAGIVVGETKLRYRNVDVGQVEQVAFAPSLAKVLVKVRLEKAIRDYVDGDAQFWIVRPEVTTRGVTGLDTVLSGVFIEGTWDTEAEGLVEGFEGLAQAPLAKGGQKGTTLTLVAATGATLSEGTPILYKGIEVGRIGKPGLLGDGENAQAEAIVYEPYDRLITSATRFWDTSGFSFKLGANGASIDFSSIASLISGGVAFDTLVSGGRPVEAGAKFDVFEEEGAARAAIFSENDGPVLNMTVLFRENFSGLAVDATVELDGVRIGQVASIRGLVDPDRFGDSDVRLLATLALRPARLGLNGTDEGEMLDYFARRVSSGLRARLATASIFTGGLKVEMVDVPDAAPAELDRAGDPYPVMPTTAGNISDVSATAEGVLKRINDLPIEELLASATEFLQSATAVAGSEDMRQIPTDIRGLIGDARGVVGSDAVKALPGQLAAMMEEIGGVAADLKKVSASLAEADLVARVQKAVDAATAAAEGVQGGAKELPALIERLNGIAAKVEALPLDQIGGDLSGALQAVRVLLAQDTTQALPGKLNGALGEVEAALTELREGGAVANLNKTLDSAQGAAASVEEAVKNLPDLSARMDALLAQARSTLAGYDQNSELNRAARLALRDLQDAAKALESLAKALERKPNSVILGR